MKRTAQIVLLLLGVGMFALQGCGEIGSNMNASIPATTEDQLAVSQTLGAQTTALPGQSRYFEETRQTVTQPFLGFWEKYGGVAVFGYPISHRVREKDAKTGEEYTAQYFERARLELHASTGDTVVVGRLGALRHAPEGPAWPKQGETFFKETGHNVPAQFMKMWNDNGGLAVFGYPITEVASERNPVDGRDYQVQYFERARFELHPEFEGTSNEVQLGRLGEEAYKAKAQPQ